MPRVPEILCHVLRSELIFKEAGMEYSFGFLLVLLATVFLLFCYGGFIIGAFEMAEAVKDPFQHAFASIFLGVCTSIFSIFLIIGLKWTPELGLPETWKICFGLLVFIGLVLGIRIEFTGNLLIDGLLISLVVSPVCFLIANGIGVFLRQWFKAFSFNTLLVLSGVFSLLFRILLWIKGGTGK